VQANPVIVKELRGRMRGWRALVVLVVYLLVLSLITWLTYLAVGGLTANTGPESSQIGKFIFGVLVIFQTIMVSLLTPAFTAGSITSEREQKTYDLLMTTLLPARSIIFGKLGSALAFVVLLIIAIAPLESLAFMFGGVSPEEIILSQVVMLMSAVLFASVGIFWSSALKSSVASNVLTYGTILFQMVGLPFFYFIVTNIMGAYSYNPYGQGITQTSGFWYGSGIVLSFHPIIAMVISESFYVMGHPLFIYTRSDLLNGQTLFVISPWLLFCIEALLVSLILIALSVRMIKPIRYKKSVYDHEPRETAPPKVEPAVEGTFPPPPRI
jgi:ABC-type transport system involved in multi-copper enzyme maturation permease subunit